MAANHYCHCRQRIGLLVAQLFCFQSMLVVDCWASSSLLLPLLLLLSLLLNYLLFPVAWISYFLKNYFIINWCTWYFTVLSLTFITVRLYRMASLVSDINISAGFCSVDVMENGRNDGSKRRQGSVPYPIANILLRGLLASGASWHTTCRQEIRFLHLCFLLSAAPHKPLQYAHRKRNYALMSMSLPSARFSLFGTQLRYFLV